MEDVLNDKSINPKKLIDINNFSSYMNWGNDKQSLSTIDDFSDVVNI